jgi:glutamine cyclotransferase
MRRVLTILAGLIMLLSLSLSLAWAKEPARPELSLSEAVKRAFAIQGLQATEEALRTAKVQYAVGMITKAKLKEAEAAVLEAKYAISALACQHAVLKASFYQLTNRSLIVF